MQSAVTVFDRDHGLGRLVFPGMGASPHRGMTDLIDTLAVYPSRRLGARGDPRHSVTFRVLSDSDLSASTSRAHLLSVRHGLAVIALNFLIHAGDA
jgi:hypothetical protein